MINTDKYKVFFECAADTEQVAKNLELFLNKYPLHTIVTLQSHSTPLPGITLGSINPSSYFKPRVYDGVLCVLQKQEFTE